MNLKVHRNILELKEMFYKLIVLVVKYMCIGFKSLQNVHLTCMNFIVSTFYLK